MALLGLDIGTTGTKATIFDNEGNVLSYAYGEYDILSVREGYYEINPITVWETVKDVIRRSHKEAGRVEIKAISTSSLGEAFVMLGKTGKELSNSAIYMDKRGEDECKALINSIGDVQLMKITGHPPQSMYSVCKLMWYKKHSPELLSKTYKILFFGDYILYKLGGQYVTDYSLAARSMCFDIQNKQWSKRILENADLNIDMFPETKVTGSIVGEILPQIANELGINQGVKLVLGGHDQIMVAVGAGITREGQAVNGIGTVDCITPLFKSARLNDNMLKYSYVSIPYLSENMFVTYAFNMTGGSLLKWFRETFAKKDKEIAEKNNVNIYKMLNKEMPKEPTDLFVLPHFAGSPIPSPDIHAKGSIMNLTLGTSREEIYKACMEGEAFEMRYNIETLEANGIAVDELRTVGGGARSPEWLQIRADVFNKKISAMRFEEAGTLGTAILAGVAAGCFESYIEASKEIPKIKNNYYPDQKNNAFYNERYEKYKLIYNMMRQIR